MHTAAEGQCTVEPPTELLPKGTQEGFSGREKSLSKIGVQQKGFQSAQEPPRVTHLLFPHKERMIAGFN